MEDKLEIIKLLMEMLIVIQLIYLIVSIYNLSKFKKKGILLRIRHLNEFFFSAITLIILMLFSYTDILKFSDYLGLSLTPERTFFVDLLLLMSLILGVKQCVLILSATITLRVPFKYYKRINNDISALINMRNYCNVYKSLVKPPPEVEEEATRLWNSIDAYLNSLNREDLIDLHFKLNELDFMKQYYFESYMIGTKFSYIKSNKDLLSNIKNNLEHIKGNK